MTTFTPVPTTGYGKNLPGQPIRTNYGMLNPGPSAFPSGIFGTAASGERMNQSYVDDHGDRAESTALVVTLDVYVCVENGDTADKEAIDYLMRDKMQITKQPIYFPEGTQVSLLRRTDRNGRYGGRDRIALVQGLLPKKTKGGLDEYVQKIEVMPATISSDVIITRPTITSMHKTTCVALSIGGVSPVLTPQINNKKDCIITGQSAMSRINPDGTENHRVQCVYPIDAQTRNRLSSATQHSTDALPLHFTHALGKWVKRYSD